MGVDVGADCVCGCMQACGLFGCTDVCVGVWMCEGVRVGRWYKGEGHRLAGRQKTTQ